MSCGKCLLYITNSLAVGLCLALLGLGMSTGLTLLTYVACGGLVIGLLGWCGPCTGNRRMLLLFVYTFAFLLIAMLRLQSRYLPFSLAVSMRWYSWCMFTLTVMCLCFIIKPEPGKSVVAEPLEQLLLAVYLKSGSLEDMPCCPKIPLERPRDWESWLASKVVGAGNQIVCAGTKLVGVLTCGELIGLILDTYGTPLAIITAVLTFTSGVSTWYEAHKVLKRSRSASPTW